ncbi:cellulose biosynthesis protein BcsP [Caballeronia sp. J97]|uniref:cellulose biosynthesis protein BcsP n=1 Tax=Caballeronia sp. J97 TaxID=2805429 RepID=UPI002AB2F001|nr:cellulose biosynthesis protein BcsP [Caballeronia sp. J97]
MNTSRDIEKLFDHFGGNAGDYQEIGRENEAKTARTRWPLLATLDFAQPAIPEIAPRRDVQPNAARPNTDEPSIETPEKPTPIHRGRQPLFTRPHRRAIPPVNPPAAESLSALRFSVLGEAASNETGTIPDSAISAKASVPPVHTPAPPVAPKAVANDAGTDKAEASRPAATFGSSLLARRAPAQVAPVTPAAQAPRAPEPTPAAPQSILGQLFQRQTQDVPSAPAGSLDAVFERLRHARPQASDSTNTQTSAGQARANRLPRS